ncbi:ATP-binding protein [Clostridium sp.]|uniref:HAMP domain-containing sensor histidine kinase n=1 Tax=Clostridium sp. TaxID=1506 RepID=UPI003464795E
MRYLINKEVRVSLKYVIIIICIALGLNILFLNIKFDEIKKGYIRSQEALVGRIYNINPSNIENIIPVITKGYSKEDEIVGKDILKNYGYYEDLEVEFVPEIYNALKDARLNIIISFIVSGLVILSIVYLSFKSIYNNIISLTEDMKQVLEGDLRDNSSNMEGDLGKLEFAFNDVKKRLRTNIDKLSKEKIFLVELLSDISHQLKTPLSSLMVFNDILSERELSMSQQIDFLDNSRIQLNRMEWLIKNLLKLAKLDAGAIVFNKKYDSLNKSIKESIEALNQKALDNKIRILFNEEEVFMVHDKEWFEEALINIIKNGIEHNKEGGYVKVSLEDNSLCNKIIIEDNGDGIDKEEISKIFIRFYKSKNNRSKESVGIGLALSKSIVESHGGIIEVESELDMFTRFTITFLKY